MHSLVTDSGSKPVRSRDPKKIVTVNSPEKAGSWIIHDIDNDAPCTGCVTTGDPNWPLTLIPPSLENSIRAHPSTLFRVVICHLAVLVDFYRSLEICCARVFRCLL
jgi:hypothetical protein